MKQNIVIMVSLPCHKCRAKAMALAARATGVSSVRITGDYEDRLEVVGDGVDVVRLVRRLCKNVGRAVILQVQEVKDNQPKEEAKPKENPAEGKKPEPLPQCYPGYYHCPPVTQTMVMCDEPGASCSIM
uniref:Uncharacterized protein n=1 Tax=Avena sativa TaxID=4498 RepID=A0ACD6A1L5_AVESA